ncbi:MAG TPA: hypothetical protein VFW02_08845, partial [Candidatus Limnocylindrales bacterium]|nr:hypothetical protein [Candidatus Limnocylindrales bacterium]
AVQLHPSAVMFALIVGAAIAGLLGAILALPITAAARDVFRYCFHRLDDPPAGPDEAVRRIRAEPLVVRPVDEAGPEDDRDAAGVSGSVGDAPSPAGDGPARTE